jgi:hypothetical protein
MREAQPENTRCCGKCKQIVPIDGQDCEGSCYFNEVETDYSDFEEVDAPDFEGPCDCVREMI